MDCPFEIKANVESASIDETLSALDLKDNKAEPRSIYFWETSSVRESLYSQGLILRLRRDVDSADCTVKFRPCDTSRLPADWQSAKEGAGWEFRIEQDWTGAEPVLSSSLASDLEASTADEAVLDRDATELFSADQLELFAGYSSYELPAPKLQLLGPVRARKWKIKLGGRKINCEEWVLDADLRFLELSGREEDPSAAAATRQQLLDLYEEQGVHVSTKPELKTKVVLDFFSNKAAC